MYRWKWKYGGLEVRDARWLRTIEEENGRLKRLVVEQALDAWRSRTCWQKPSGAHRPAESRELPAGGVDAF